ncbi:14249_t:CDS:2 [Funneliformis geosporum]|nr:14249_t:CDS:2 [Funneliformis geosporum]
MSGVASSSSIPVTTTKNKEVLDIERSDIKIIEDNRVAGLAFLDLTEQKLVNPPYNLLGGPAGAIANLVKRINDTGQGKEDSALKIRKSYRDLLSVIFDDEIRKLRITGNPGIVKTYFIYYLLYQLALRDAIVVYDNFNETRPIIFEGEKALISDSDGIEVYLRNLAVWYIINGRQPKNVNAKTILICSLKRVHYAQFDKYTGLTIRYIPRWNWKEIKNCRKKLYNDKVPLELTQELFSNWGVIPRYVLEKANDRTQQSKLNDAIKTLARRIFLILLANVA